NRIPLSQCAEKGVPAAPEDPSPPPRAGRGSPDGHASNSRAGRGSPADMPFSRAGRGLKGSSSPARGEGVKTAVPHLVRKEGVPPTCLSPSGERLKGSSSQLGERHGRPGLPLPAQPARGEAEKRLPLPARGEGWGEGYAPFGERAGVRGTFSCALEV